MIGATSNRALALMLLGLLLILPGCLGACLVEGTMVLTPAGEIPVESLCVGDSVVSRDELGILVKAEVVATRSAWTEQVVRLDLSSGRLLEVTSEHPVWAEGSWRRAGTLREGDRSTGTDREIAVVHTAKVNKRCRVFDLTVEPGSCFFASGILVHNKTVPDRPKLADLQGDWVASSHYRFVGMRIASDGQFFLSMGKDLLTARLKVGYDGRASWDEQSSDLTRPGGDAVLGRITLYVEGPDLIRATLHSPPGGYQEHLSFLPWKAAGDYLEGVDWQGTGTSGSGR